MQFLLGIRVVFFCVLTYVTWFISLSFLVSPSNTHIHSESKHIYDYVHQVVHKPTTGEGMLPKHKW